MVLGISTDDVKSHRKFRAKYELPYPLLADVDHAVAERYGVWQPKTLFGVQYVGVVRTTFVVGADGRILHVFEKVSPGGHADEVADFLDNG